jgi:tRNA (guanine-N(7)-)-methyltransferase subunit TRM82
MAFPYQCLVARTGSTAAPHEWTLFGASGAKLVVQSSTGASSVWPEQDIQARVSGMHPVCATDS